MKEFTLESLKKNMEPLKSVIGSDSDQSWEIRKKLLKEKDIHHYANGETITKSMYGENIAKSMIGLDSDNAQEMREELFKEMLNDNGQHPSYYSSVLLKGLESDRAYEMREKLLEKKDSSGYEEKKDISKSLSGLESDRAWKMREEMLKKGLDISYSLVGLDSDRSWEMRESLYKKYPEGIADSLLGLDSDRAWEMRGKIYDILDKKGPGKVQSVYDSFGKLNSDRAKEFYKAHKFDPNRKIERSLMRGGFGLPDTDNE